MRQIGLVCVMSALATAGYLFGCEHNEGSNAAAVPDTRAGQYGATSAQAEAADTAIVDRLSTVRCERELSCNNIGQGRKYASLQVCTDQMRGAMANDLNSYKCPQGINRDQVEHCMAAIRNEQCDHPLDTITRMDKCRANQLCLK